MPVLARFYGMVIKMYFMGKEHGVAHIHAIYGEYVGVIDIHSGEMLEGDLPAKALSMVQEWIMQIMKPCWKCGIRRNSVSFRR